jgi:hypothetical protein
VVVGLAMVMALDVAPEAADDLVAMIAVHVAPGTAMGEPFLVARDREGEVTLLCRDPYEQWGVGPGAQIWRLSEFGEPCVHELTRWSQGREAYRAAAVK